MSDALTVADFFCGAGGFSEGFRQAGFKVIFGMDNWPPALRTHRLNHSESRHPEENDLLYVHPAEINRIIPDTDVIIGSPPCVTFSSSNRAGKADKTKGIQLIKKFLQIVAVKKYKQESKLKYWLMENVPNSRRYLQEKYSFFDLGLTNDLLRKLSIHKDEKDIALALDLSDRCLYNSVNYGVPQRRERFICGEFPHPEPSTSSPEQWIKLGAVLNAFRTKGETIIDPLYKFHFVKDELTDHYYDTEIPRFEWEEAKLKKQQARYYGKMSFPEDESKPSRTIMATRSIIAREAMILSNGKPETYRLPTIREIATIMSFPITYIFDGRDEATKYKLVGNAVCPRLAYHFACSILKKCGFKPKQEFETKVHIPDNFNNLAKNNPKKKQPRFKIINSSFVEIVPDLKYKNFRVELDNNHPKRSHKLKWRASIHHATGKKSMKYAYPKLNDVKKILNTYPHKDKTTSFYTVLDNYFKDKIPISSEVFQNQYCNPKKDRRYHTPRELLVAVKNLVDKHFPLENYGVVTLSNTSNPKKGAQFIHFNRERVPNNRIPLRHLIALYSLMIAISYIKKP